MEQPLFLLHCKGTLVATSQKFESLLLVVQNILKEFGDLFPKVVLREIELQNDFVLGVNLPNKPTYRTIPERLKRYI